MVHRQDRTTRNPRMGATEVALGVQTALQTSPQRPRSQPPPGGPSGKLERDSVCPRPWGGSGGGGGEGQRSHAPFPSASWANPRGGGWNGRGTRHKTKGSKQQGTRGKARIKGLIRISFWVLPSGRPNSQTTQGPGEHSRVRLPNLHSPYFSGDKGSKSFQMSHYRPPQI